MKKNTTLLLIIAIVALAVIAYFVSGEEEGKPMSDFAIENVEDINKFIISRTDGSSITIENIDGVWMCNNEFKARDANIELLLKTFKNISVQSSVSSDLKKTVVGNMASRHKKVQIFENGKNTKTYFIGSPTSDHYGTYMLLEKNGKKSSEAYVMHLPGFNGFLESRFYTEIKDWKHTGVYTMNPENIKQIKVEHYESPENSYVITQADGRFDFTTIDGVPVGDYNLTLLQNYVRTYEKIFYNQIGDYTENQVDSIKKEDPTYIVSVTDNADNVKQVFFTLKETGETMDSITGKAIAYDVNMIHGYYPEGEEIYLFQYFSLDNMFAKKSYFIQK